MNKWDHISAFITVVQEKGFAAAAKKMNLSTAAISRKISRLEAELHTHLLQRTTRTITLTETGVQYYESCLQAIGLLSSIESDIAASRKEPDGRLYIVSNRYFAMHYLIPHLPDFKQKYPKIQLTLELAERFPNLATEGIDLLFGVSLEGPAELVRRRVTSTRYVLCASPLYLQQHGTPKTPEDLATHQYITHSMRQPDNRIYFKNHQEVTVKPVLRLNDAQAMLECAISGMGIIALHEYIVKDALQQGLLTEIPGGWMEPNIPVYLYYQQQRYLQPEIRCFIDFYLARDCFD